MLSILFILNFSMCLSIIFLLSDQRQKVKLKQVLPRFYSLKTIGQKTKWRFPLEILYTRSERDTFERYKALISLVIISGLFFYILIVKPGILEIFVIMTIIVMIPLGHMIWRLGKLTDQLESHMLSFMQNLHAGFLQSGEMIQALKYCSDHSNSEYIKRLLERFLYNILKGMSPNLAFEQLRTDSHHDYFAYVILNLEQIYHRRGKVLELIQNLQNEYTAIKIELNKRHVELRQEKAFVIICTSIFWGVWYYMFYSNSYLWAFYMDNELYIYVFATLVATLAVTVFMIVKSNHLKY